ncbi:MAG: LysR family transcriptional regulator [Oscillospiraceae bacterium]|nr:LysR family transcriptional regulator [Oscillospiraceae bacterium]
MDLKTLSYFVTVAEELNISHAAEKLNMSQPPLSYQIKNLEQELNTVLFIRGKRSLQMTESGQLLYRRAKEILSLANKAEEEIISMGEGMKGTISIGLVEGTAPHIAGEWFAGFYRLYPNVRFRILDGNSDDLVDKLRSGLISLAVITSPCDGQLLNSFTVGKEPMTAFIHPSHPLALKEGDSLSVSSLIGEPLIVPSRRAVIDNIYRWFREFRSEPTIVCEMDSYLDAAALAERQMGISIFPQTAYVPNSSLVKKRIEGDNRTIEYLFAWRKGHPLPTLEEQFIDFVKLSTESNTQN